VLLQHTARGYDFRRIKHDTEHQNILEEVLSLKLHIPLTLFKLECFWFLWFLTQW
jgi:hypothetical protein